VPASASRTALMLASALCCVALAGCSAGPSEFAGRVADDTVSVQIPSSAMPSVNLDTGFTPKAPSGTTPPQRSSVATAVALTRIGSFARVESVAVQPGDDVRAGDEIARLDARAHDANIAVAKAALTSAKAQVSVLDDAIDTVASNRSTLATQRAQIDDAAAQLTNTRAQLAAQLADLKALLARIEALGAGGGRPPMPPGGVPTDTIPPGTSPPGTLPPGGIPDPAQVRAGIAKLTAALAKIDSGLAKVASGRAKLSSAGAKLSDARAQLTDLRRLARAGVDGAKVGVQIAGYQRSLAILRSPVDGTVVSVVAVGDVLAPGATAAEIRRSGPPRVTTWIAPEQLADIEVGTQVEVSADWFPTGGDGGGPSTRRSDGRGSTSPIPGRVTTIGTRAEYPPTSFATSEIHLTRAIRVEMTLSPSAEHPALPPGTPVDVRFLGK